VWYQNICGAAFRFVTIDACDRQTDGQIDKQTDKIRTPKTTLAYDHMVKMIYV